MAVTDDRLSSKIKTLCNREGHLIEKNVSNQQSSNGEGSVEIFWGAEPGHCPVPMSGNIEFNLKFQLLWLGLYICNKLLTEAWLV